MVFWIKILLLAGFAWTTSQVVRSEALWSSYYGTFGTPDELHAYERNLAIRHIISDGDDSSFIEFARHLP